MMIVYLWVGCACHSKEDIEVKQVPMRWWYDAAGTKFWEGLPIGTGRFGAMIPGQPLNEVIAFNDETLWTGGPYNPNNPEGTKTLAKIREKAFARDWQGANDAAWGLSSIPQSVQYYQPMGRIHIQMLDTLSPVSNYSRALSMDSALVLVNYEQKGIRYDRQYFASYPEQVIVVRLTANQSRALNFRTWLSSLQPTARLRGGNNEIIMEGATISEKSGETILPPQMRWQARLKVLTEGGTVTFSDSVLSISGADAVTLILAGATNWKAWNDISANEKEQCAQYINKATQMDYHTLVKRHLDDYCPLFSSCKIDLGNSPYPAFTTTRVMDSLRAGHFDPAYEARYFQYGRYLLLAAARENTLAFNNHNLWLDDMEGRWRGRWTLNINIQECYWCVENTHLPKINESLLWFVENLAAAGERTAKELYGCRGWCSHHGTDVWFNTAPTDGAPVYATWPMSGLWLMQQLYDHYQYSLDTVYLKRIYPLLKGAALFCLDFLVKDPESGYWVTCPSTSPENSFLDDKGHAVAVSYGATNDIAAIRDLLSNYVESARVLNVDASMRTQSEEILTLLPPYKIGSFGQLQEWFHDFKENEVTHRHMSHLFAFYPDDDITLRGTPELAKAVKTVLLRRGDNNRGWSGAWKINLHARLEEPEEAYAILSKMLTEISLHPSPEDSKITPSFEGNQAIQGVTAGMTEMLMQSHSHEISLLPALPAAWANGAISGLRARGGYDIDLAWQNGQLYAATLTAHRDQTCHLRTKTPVNVFHRGKKIPVKQIDNTCITFNVKAGEQYRVTGQTK